VKINWVNTRPIIQDVLTTITAITKQDNLSFTIPKTMFIDTDGNDLIFTLLEITTLNGVAKVPNSTWIGFD
jgi:hypothetical protein